MAAQRFRGEAAWPVQLNQTSLGVLVGWSWGDQPIKQSKKYENVINGADDSLVTTEKR